MIICLMLICSAILWFMRLEVVLQDIILCTMQCNDKNFSQDLDCRLGWEHTAYVSVTLLY